MYRTQTNLGKALQIAGSAESALEAYERALAIDSRHGDVYNNMATLLHQQGRIDDAIGWYRKALTRYPEYEEIHQNLADAYSQKGCLDSAAVLYEAAIGIDDRNGAIWANYGQTLYRSGDLDGAEKALRRSLELLPQQGEPYNNLGNIHADRGTSIRLCLPMDELSSSASSNWVMSSATLVISIGSRGTLNAQNQILSEPSMRIQAMPTSTRVSVLWSAIGVVIERRRRFFEKRFPCATATGKPTQSC